MIDSMDCKRLGIVMLLVLMVSSTSIYAGRNDGDGAFGQRCREYLEYYSEHGDTTWLYGVFRQLARHGVGKPLESRYMNDVIKTIKSNHDCNDFTLNGLLRMAYIDRKQPFMTGGFRDSVRNVVLDFKYWWDDGRRDTTYRCYHTENHQALYHTAELLAGQLYKSSMFSNGMTGKEHISHAMNLIVPWLDNRLRFGFSEWLSTYYDVEALLLANLVDYAEDREIRRKARSVLDLLMFDMALHNFRGYLAGASGRTYASSLLSGVHVVSPMVRLMFGVGTYEGFRNTGAVALATSGYRCPKLISGIATDYDTSHTVIQRTSINVEDAPLYGIDFSDERQCHLFWGMQEFIHPLCISMSKQISEKYDTWPYHDYDRYIDIYTREIEETGRAADRDRFALSEGNITTVRCASWMLSAVNDFRMGKAGYQQHPWMASLSHDAVVYTNHPGGKNLRNSPNYWAGNEVLPRVAQIGDIVVCIYAIPESHKTDYTHAYMPVEKMDTVMERDSWTFARKGDGYLALYCSVPTRLMEDFRGELCDMVASGRSSIWICQMGDREKYGDFDNFVETIAASEVVVNDKDVCYASPSAGKVTFGWDGPLTVDGKVLELRSAYRYHTPWGSALFGADELTLKRNGMELKLELR